MEDTEETKYRIALTLMLAFTIIALTIALRSSFEHVQSDTNYFIYP